MLTTQIRLVQTLAISNGIMHPIQAVVAWTASTWPVPQRWTFENCILHCQCVSVFCTSLTIVFFFFVKNVKYLVLLMDMEYVLCEGGRAELYVKKVKWSHYRSGVAQRVGRDIALLFHNRGTRKLRVVSSTPRPHVTPGKTRYPLYRRLGGPQGRSWRAENLVPTGIRSRIFQSGSQSLYRLSYPAHRIVCS